KEVDAETLRLKLAVPNAERIFYLAQAFKSGMPIEEIFELTKIDRWFLRNVKQIVEEDSRLRLSRQTAVTAVDRTEDRGAGFQPVGTTGVPPVATSEFRPVDPRAPVIQTRRRLPEIASAVERRTGNLEKISSGTLGCFDKVRVSKAISGCARGVARSRPWRMHPSSLADCGNGCQLSAPLRWRSLRARFVRGHAKSCPRPGPTA